MYSKHGSNLILSNLNPKIDSMELGVCWLRWPWGLRVSTDFNHLFCFARVLLILDGNFRPICKSFKQEKPTGREHGIKRTNTKRF